MFDSHASPFQIVVLGDFGGQRGSRKLPLKQRKPIAVDRDNFDAVMNRVGVTLRDVVIAPGQPGVDLHFCGLTDFHPDTLYRKLDPFLLLENVRARLFNTETFESAAAEVLAWDGSATEDGQQSLGDTSPVASPSKEMKSSDDGNLMKDVLEQTEVQLGSDSVSLDRMVDEITAPYAEPKTDARRPELIRCVDQQSQFAMNTLLHHEPFRELEAIWRGLQLLVRRVDTDANLHIYLIDISKAELEEDLMAADELVDSAVGRMLLESPSLSTGGDTLLIGHYEHGRTARDATTLWRISEIAEKLDATYISAAADQFGMDGKEGQVAVDEDDVWDAICDLRNASHLGLVWPRFLLRLPYGHQTSPLESFEYEETADLSNLLLGNSALLCGVIIGQSVSRLGRDTTESLINEVGGLPVWVNETDGVQKTVSGGAFVLSDRERGNLVGSGIIPVISYRGRDVVRIQDWCSIQGTALSGCLSR